MTESTERKDIDIEMQAAQRSKASQEKSKKSGGKPQKKSSVVSGLSFGPYAEYTVTGTRYLLFLCGICSFASSFKTDFTNNDEFYMDWFQFSAGIYCVVLSLFLSLWQLLGTFNKEDKSINAILEPRHWPSLVTTPITFFHNYLIQCFACIVFSVPTFISVMTVVSGAGLLFAAFLFFVSFLRREKSRKITGIR